MSVILALDPATRTGWALITGGSQLLPVLSGTADLGGGPHGERFKWLYQWLIENASKVDLLVYEQSGHGRGHAVPQQFQLQLMGIIELFAAERDIRTASVHPSTIKAWATGHGGAKKEQMMRALKTMYDFEARDDNEADAVWLAMYAAQNEAKLLNPPAKKTKARRTKLKGDRQAKMFGGKK